MVGPPFCKIYRMAAFYFRVFRKGLGGETNEEPGATRTRRKDRLWICRKIGLFSYYYLGLSHLLFL